MQDILEEERVEEERKREAAERPIREAEQRLTETHNKLFNLEKAEVIAGRPDPGFTIPDSCSSLRMSVQEAIDFARGQGAKFVAETPDYYPCRENFETINNYLAVNGITIPHVDVYKIALERLRTFGMIKERTAPAPTPEAVPEEPAQEPNPPTEAPSSEELIGWDPATGGERVFTKREVDLMSSEEFRRIFRLCGDRRPKFTRSRYQ